MAALVERGIELAERLMREDWEGAVGLGTACFKSARADPLRVA